MRMRFINWLVLASILISPVALSACNTTAGVGKDVERSGEWMQKKANDAKD